MYGLDLCRSFNSISPSVKSSLAHDGHYVLWDKGDRISIYDGLSNNCFSIDESSINGAYASFSGSVSKDSKRFVALYPYSENASFSGLRVSAHLPADQTVVPGNFDPSCALAADVTEDESLVFHNLVSLVKVILGAEHDNVESIHLKGNNSEALAGNFSVDLDLDAGPTNFTRGSETEIVASGDLKAGGVYYLAVIGNTSFSMGLDVVLEYSDGRRAEKKIYSAIVLSAGMIFNVDMAGTDPVPPFGSDVLTFSKRGSSVITLNGFLDVEPVTSIPSGWKLSVSDGNKVSIIAPDTIEGVDLDGQIAFSCRNASGAMTELTLKVRLCGINNLQDFKDFRDASMNGGDVGKYINGAVLSLNTDIVIGPDDMLSDRSCFLHSLSYPLEGNGKTITINNSTSADMNAVIGYLRANVSNLNLAGTLSATNSTCRMAALAANCGWYPAGKQTVTLSNVNSSVNITYSNSASSSSQIAGLVAICSGVSSTVEFKNCTVTGKIRTNQSILDTGGFIGRGESGSPGVVVSFTDCVFSGEIEYSQTVPHANPRVGGFVASGERQTRYTRCTNNGKITANLNNTVFDPDGGGGIGGILGRSSKVTSGYNMGWYLDTVTTTCSITINGQPKTAPTSYFGKIIGSKLDEAQQYSNVVESGTLTINLF